WGVMASSDFVFQNGSCIHRMWLAKRAASSAAAIWREPNRLIKVSVGKGFPPGEEDEFFQSLSDGVGYLPADGDAFGLRGEPWRHESHSCAAPVDASPGASAVRRVPARDDPGRGWLRTGTGTSPTADCAG